MLYTPLSLYSGLDLARLYHKRLWHSRLTNNIISWYHMTVIHTICVHTYYLYSICIHVRSHIMMNAIQHTTTMTKTCLRSYNLIRLCLSELIIIIKTRICIHVYIYMYVCVCIYWCDVFTFELAQCGTHMYFNVHTYIHVNKYMGFWQKCTSM